MSNIDPVDPVDPEDAEHDRGVIRDRAHARKLDEREVRERSIEAWDRFVQMGFAAHLVAVKVRGAIEYTLALYPDGADSIPSEAIQQVAAELNFDFVIEKDQRKYDHGGWALLMYPLA